MEEYEREFLIAFYRQVHIEALTIPHLPLAYAALSAAVELERSR